MKNEKNIKVLVITIACIVIPFVLFKIFAPAVNRYVANPFIGGFTRSLFITILSVMGLFAFKKVKFQICEFLENKKFESALF